VRGPRARVPGGVGRAVPALRGRPGGPGRGGSDPHPARDDRARAARRGGVHATSPGRPDLPRPPPPHPAHPSHPPTLRPRPAHSRGPQRRAGRHRGRRDAAAAWALSLEEIAIVRRLITTMVLVSMLTATGASAAGMDKCPAQGGTIRAAMAGSPPTLDFITSFAAQARDMGVYIYEGLVTIDANYDVAPQLAEKWTASAD